ncbi:MAG: hypothetical protein V3V20_09880 [Algisphaera sp.]
MLDDTAKKIDAKRLRQLALCRCRGTAMIEAVLVLPLILALLALLFYLGGAMQRHERAAIASRYVAWRAAAKAPGPQPAPTGSNAEIKESFFVGLSGASAAEGSADVDADISSGYPSEPSEAWATAAGSVSFEAESLARAYADRLPSGVTGRVTVQHVATVPLWTQITSGVSVGRHIRLDGDWRFTDHVVNVEHWHDDQARANHNLDLKPAPTQGPVDAVRDTFYPELENALSPLAGGNDLARALDRFYRLYPGYAGPAVEMQWNEALGFY